MKEDTLKVNDRLSVFLRTWQPAGRLRMAVALVHGLGEHSGEYGGVAAFLAGKGALVLAPDLPGHGKNPGTRGNASYALFDEVVAGLLAEVRRRAGAGRPVFLYGHSTGANRALWWQITHPGDRLAGIVASSPSFGGPKPRPTAAKKALARVLAVLAPSVIMENGLDLSALSRDPAVLEEIRRDPLFHTKLSVRIGVDFLRSWAWFARWPGGSLASPVLILQGTADRIVDPDATITVAGKLKGDVTVRILDGYYHLLAREPERREVLGFIADWMDKHLS